MARKTRLTHDLIEAIADRVRREAFPYIAAQSCGIPKSTFYKWMQKGEDGRGIYRELWDRVSSAAADTRRDAENRVFRDKPLEWLRLGPGRERVDEAGWTEAAKKVTVEGGERPIQIGHYEEPGDAALAETLMVMEEIGLFQLTPEAVDYYNRMANSDTESEVQSDSNNQYLVNDGASDPS